HPLASLQTNQPGSNKPLRLGEMTANLAFACGKPPQISALTHISDKLYLCVRVSEGCFKEGGVRQRSRPPLPSSLFLHLSPASISLSPFLRMWPPFFFSLCALSPPCHPVCVLSDSPCIS
uniref:Uncharacterized protein n=1 Tax=Oryzias melastigma TaxID=30732 RepID=A0A3B3BRC2_ORYME